MKNMDKNSIRTSIVTDLDGYEHILSDAFGRPVSVELVYDGLEITDMVKSREVETDEIMKVLEGYFGVKEITSIHIDDEENVGVWITFKE